MFRTFAPCLRISAQFLQIVLGFLNEFLTVNVSEILMRVILQNFNACVYMSERCLSKFPTANLIKKKLKKNAPIILHDIMVIPFSLERV